MNPRCIAMWSGPRNISTAMLRAWGSRADTFVIDEPFYAHYLSQSHHREEHPGADEIIATYENDWRKVAESLTGDAPSAMTEPKPIFYQKHMTHHMLDHIDLAWTDVLTNCFLIREPREVIASYIKVIPNLEIDQTGLPQQIKIFNYVRQVTGKIPPVIDSADVLKDPRRLLTLLCEAVNLPFDESMLKWEAGTRTTDGVWAKYWYAAVERSTEFAPYQKKDEPIPDHLQDLVAECEALYQEMYQYRLGK